MDCWSTYRQEVDIFGTQLCSCCLILDGEQSWEQVLDGDQVLESRQSLVRWPGDAGCETAFR